MASASSLRTRSSSAATCARRSESSASRRALASASSLRTRSSSAATCALALASSASRRAFVAASSVAVRTSSASFLAASSAARRSVLTAFSRASSASCMISWRSSSVRTSSSTLWARIAHCLCIVLFSCSANFACWRARETSTYDASRMTLSTNGEAYTTKAFSLPISHMT